MNRSRLGPAVVGLLVVGIGTFLFLNIDTGRSRGDRPSSSGASQPSKTPASDPAPPPAGGGVPVREFPIGDEVKQNHIRVAAVWLPAVTMEGMAAEPGSHLVHIEADVKALEDNPNGFAKDEKVDYLKIHYKLVPAAGGKALAEGDLSPMIARDGFHYGASIALPEPGDYRLLYEIQPPSAGGLGRHSDPATGVAAWWEPFQAAFDWSVTPEDMQVTAR